MQKITTSIMTAFSRTPSIKFLGPRDLIQHEPVPASTPPQNAPIKHQFTPLNFGPPLSRPSVRSPALEQWQIDTINSGGVIESKPIKVKSIPLKKK